MKKYSYLTMVGHACADINQGALPALLPFIIFSYGFSYAQAATIVTCANLVSAVVQPLFGWLDDRHDWPWTMAAGVFLAGLGVSCIGFAGDNYWLILLCASVSGLGVALFHPEGGRIANMAAGEKKGTGISIFAVGGNVGFTVGPLIAVIAMGLLRTAGTLVFCIPCTIFAIFTLCVNRQLLGLSDLGRKQVRENSPQDNVMGFSLVAAAACIRSICYTGILTFVPLFFVGVLAQSEEMGSAMLSVYAVVGIFATIVGGRMADRIGLRKFVRWFTVFVVPVFVLFAFNTSVTAAVVLLLLMGFGMSIGYSSMTALGQTYLPNHVALATGITMGVGTAVGGIAAPALGAIGDSLGLVSVFWVMTVIIGIVAVLLLFVPKTFSE